MASPLSFSSRSPLLSLPSSQPKSPPFRPPILHGYSLIRSKSPSLTIIRAKNDKGDGIAPPDRLLSAACYLYPFLDGVQYGKYVITQFPAFQLLLQPLVPAIRLFKGFPLNGLLIFFTLYFAVVRNPGSFSRFVRFNTMQAIVLDVLLIFPDLLERSFSPRGGVGLDLIMSLDSTVFLFLLVSLVYGSSSCLFGQIPKLPIVAEAAERQVM
ncbi:TIC 20-v-like protein [Wolffia australiana]